MNIDRFDVFEDKERYQLKTFHLNKEQTSKQNRSSKGLLLKTTVKLAHKIQLKTVFVSFKTQPML